MGINTVFIELGSNQGNRYELLQHAIQLLQKEGCKLLQQSSIYETPPWGFEAEQNFYNMVIKLATSKNAFELLHVLMEIETKLGRTRGIERYSSRTIDLDILFFNDEIIESTELSIPHERLHLRNFVLEPLNEISQDLVHPVFNKTINELMKQCTDEAICKKLSLKP